MNHNRAELMHNSRPPPLKVITSGAFAAALKTLAPIYTQETGETVELHFGSSLGAAHDSIPTRLAQRECFDIFILARQALDEYAAQGHLAPGRGWDLVESHIGVAVRSGDDAPDISTLDSFKQTLLSAPRVALAASASGIYLSKEVFPKLNIAAQMARTTITVYSERVGHVIARGEADLGFQQVSEILPIRDVKLVGLLPPMLRRPFLFSAAIGVQCKDPVQLARVKRFLQFLADQPAAEVIKQTGLEPLFPVI